MSMTRLAFLNFKSSFKHYLALIISMAFTILVFLNFQTVIYSDLFLVLGEHNKEYIDIVVRVISFVLGCFMFFFLWYATNVFLTKRKKEIGIYIFMGLSNQKIGRLYMIETALTGAAALGLGIGLGILTTQLFQMILLAISEISVDITFQFQAKPVLITSGIFLVLYMIFVFKGYVNIVRSSVLDMVLASKQNEYVRQNPLFLAVKAAAGLFALFAGYYLAVKEGGQEVMGNVFAATVLVVVGVYLLFGGFLPIVFQNLAKKKSFLYQKQRNLWVNNVIFRMKKNYRAYAITCVMMLCSVTALATGFAMKARYKSIVNCRNTYTFQFMQFESGGEDLDGKITALIEQDNDIAYKAQMPVLMIDSSVFDTKIQHAGYGALSYSKLKDLAKNTGLEFDLEEPKDGEVICVSHMYLLSLLTDRSSRAVTVNGKEYVQTGETNVPYLGYFQDSIEFYVFNDREYEKLLPLGQEVNTYNYRIKDIYNFAASVDELEPLSQGTGENQLGRVTIDPESSDIEWIKVLYTVCIFMFLVFVLASGSVLFMKLYNDAFEERERYGTLKKLGISQKTLKKSLSHELKTAYAMPFLLMAVSSYFSVHALEKMMNEDLMRIYGISVAIIFVIFFCCYKCSVSVSSKICGAT